MFDVFTEEIEVFIKDGIANLYWYKGDLHKAWLRSGVPSELKDKIASESDEEGKLLSKRRQMDMLYEILRVEAYERRLEISRNFVRILVEHKGFTPQNERHRVEIAERCSLKLRELIAKQNKEQENKQIIHTSAKKNAIETYDSKLSKLRHEFEQIQGLDSAKRGYELEKIFVKLMTISDILVEKGFSIKGEQIDCAIKYDGCYYLIELKWTAKKADPKEIGHFFYKVEGKLEARGIFLSINGFSDGAISSLPTGKKLRVILLDGNHLANVIYGQYKFNDLLEYAIRQASLHGKIYCAHNLQI